MMGRKGGEGRWKKGRRRKVEDGEEEVRFLSHYLFFTFLPPSFSQRKGGGR